MRQTLLVKFDGHKIECEERECYESRGKSVSSMIRSAFDLLSASEILRMKPFSFEFFLGDNTLCFEKHYHLSFSYSSYHQYLIPCFAFDRWSEVGLHDYTEVCGNMIKRSIEPPKDSRLLWIGNCATNKCRSRFVELTKNDPRISAVDIVSWHKESGLNRLATKNGQYVSMEDHCDYKYLIDLEGAGWSARTKMLFHSGRPVFYQNRRWNEYWFFDMIPFKHYIPIKNDLSDFYEKFEWAVNNETNCLEIAANALEFAKIHLTRESAISRYKSILLLLGGT